MERNGYIIFLTAKEATQGHTQQQKKVEKRKHVLSKGNGVSGQKTKSVSEEIVDSLLFILLEASQNFSWCSRWLVLSAPIIGRHSTFLS